MLKGKKDKKKRKNNKKCKLQANNRIVQQFGVVCFLSLLTINPIWLYIHVVRQLSTFLTK